MRPRTITREIELALVGLRLQRELGRIVSEAREALARVSEEADRALERDESDGLPLPVLAELSGAAALRADEAERVLEHVLSGARLPTPGPSQELRFIEAAVSGALARAAAIERFDDARPELALAADLVGRAIRVSIRSGIPLPARIDELVRDFDHAEEPGLLRGIHGELRAGRYHARFRPKRARLRWLRPDEGGRRSLPAGPRYVAPARVQVAADLWPHEAWSLVITFDPKVPPVYEMEVAVELLFPESAPPDALAPGTWFELYEGAKRVATGTVLAPSEGGRR